jgi:hypothetical protein
MGVALQCLKMVPKLETHHLDTPCKAPSKQLGSGIAMNAVDRLPQVGNTMNIRALYAIIWMCIDNLHVHVMIPAKRKIVGGTQLDQHFSLDETRIPIRPTICTEPWSIWLLQENTMQFLHDLVTTLPVD